MERALPKWHRQTKNLYYIVYTIALSYIILLCMNLCIYHLCSESSVYYTLHVSIEI